LKAGKNVNSATQVANSIALQKFLESLLKVTTRGGVKGFFPAGRYEYSQPVSLLTTVPSSYYVQGLRLEGAVGGNRQGGKEGDGPVSTVLHYTGTGTGITLGNPGNEPYFDYDPQLNPNISYVHGVHVENLHFSATAQADRILQITGGSPIFRNCKFSGASKSNGSYITGAFGVDNKSIISYWENCIFTENFTGIKSRGTLNVFFNCVFHTNGSPTTYEGAGAFDAFGMGSQYISCLFQNNYGVGLALDGVMYDKDFRRPLVKNCWFENNNKNANSAQLYVRGFSATQKVIEPEIRSNIFAQGGAANVAGIGLNTYVDNPIIKDNFHHNPSFPLLWLINSTVTNLNYKFVPKTDNYLITHSDNEKIFTNEGATAQVTFTLPGATVTGLKFTFIKLENQNLVIQAAAGDKINGGAVQRRYQNTSAEAGIATCTLVCTKAGAWQVIAEKGTWVNDNS
jgi:hypothetical protein